MQIQNPPPPALTISAAPENRYFSTIVTDDFQWYALCMPYNVQLQRNKDRMDAMKIIIDISVAEFVRTGRRRFKGNAQIQRIIDYLCETAWK